MTLINDRKEEMNMKKGLVATVASIIGMAVGAGVSSKLAGKTISAKAEKIEKFKNYYGMLNQWLLIRQEGKTLQEYLIRNNYKKIAIYGMGEMGNRLNDELKDSGVKVEYAVDKDAAGVYSELNVVDPEEEFAEVDAIIVTATFAYESIREILERKVDFPIISLEDVVFEV